MILSTILIALLAGASAFTPPGFEPASATNLTVAFGSTLAVSGIDVLRDETASFPSLGTPEHLTGTYALMMVDPDLPTSPPSELLHWLQSGLTSSNESSTVGGVKVFALLGASNATAAATYIQPSPPFKVPFSHRYVQLLLDTSNISTSGMQSLLTAAKIRQGFDAVGVIKSSGASIVGSNWFNVTNAQALGNGTTAGNGTTGGNTTVPSGGSSPTTSLGGGGVTVTSTATADAGGSETATSSGGVATNTVSINAGGAMRWDATVGLGMGIIAYGVGLW